MKILSQKETFETIMSTVNKLVSLVSPTFGPAGNKVIIGKSQLYSSALDDGVQIAKDLELDNEAENYVLKIIREVAVKTNDRTGDGTTGSLIILQALMKEIEKEGRIDGRKITAELKQGLIEAVAQLHKQAKKIKTKSDLEKVARISFDNEEVSKLLAEIVYKIGADGLIDVEASPGLHIESEMVDGFKIPGGYLSPYFVTEKEECILENPYILVTDSNFVNAQEIVPIMERLLKAGHNTLAILSKGLEGEALATAVVNKMQGKFKTLAVKVFENYEDIALLTGATAFTAEKGKITPEVVENIIQHLGRAKKIISKKDSTVIIGGKGNKTEIKKKISQLQKKMDESTVPLIKEQARYKLAQFTGSVAVIKVGANTENEAKALRYKIEDASNAVKVAYKHGVVKGGGVALMDLKTSSPILNKALQYPHMQLEENLGTKFVINSNVIDPVEVLVAGLESAVSIACLLATTKGIIVEEKEKTK